MAAVTAIAVGVIAANEFRIAAAERSTIGIIVQSHDAKCVALCGSEAIDGAPPRFGPETGSDHDLAPGGIRRPGLLPLALVTLALIAVLALIAIGAIRLWLS